jgi:hypothetical protein
MIPTVKMVVKAGELARKRFGTNGVIGAMHCVLHFSDYGIDPMKSRIWTGFPILFVNQ